jgi:hypothetical protein
MTRWWPSASLVVGAALPVLDGSPDASIPVRAASVALLLAAAVGAGRAWVAGRAPLAAVGCAGAAGLALLQVRHLL